MNAQTTFQLTTGIGPFFERPFDEILRLLEEIVQTGRRAFDDRSLETTNNRFDITTDSTWKQNFDALFPDEAYPLSWKNKPSNQLFMCALSQIFVVDNHVVATQTTKADTVAAAIRNGLTWQQYYPVPHRFDFTTTRRYSHLRHPVVVGTLLGVWRHQALYGRPSELTTSSYGFPINNYTDNVQVPCDCLTLIMLSLIHANGGDARLLSKSQKSISFLKEHSPAVFDFCKDFIHIALDFYGCPNSKGKTIQMADIINLDMSRALKTQKGKIKDGVWSDHYITNGTYTTLDPLKKAISGKLFYKNLIIWRTLNSSFHDKAPESSVGIYLHEYEQRNVFATAPGVPLVAFRFCSECNLHYGSF
jgi:hypothetical protein